MSVLHPTIQSIKGYAGSKLKPDLIAGLNVAMVAIPQALAYATLVGVNPVYGLYAAIIPAIVAAIFGSSNHVVTGPTNTIALATSGILAVLAVKADFPEFAFALAILSGLFRLLLGVLKLGVVIRYVSNAVLTGFLSGAAILIISNQLPEILGLTGPHSHDLIGLGHFIVTQISESNLLILGLGLSCILLLYLARNRFPKLPGALIVVLLSGLAVQVFGLQEQGVRLVGEMGRIETAGLRFHIPEIALSRENLGPLLAGAGALALLSLLEAVSVAKAIALQTGQRINANQEFIGQGLASLVGGFFQGIPTSGSLTRSAVNYGGGAATRAASGISGVLVFLVLLAFKGWIDYIPVFSLAAIVIVSALRLIDFHHIAITWRGRLISKIVIGVTFMAVLVLPLQISIYLGVGLSIVFYLIESSRLELSYLVLNGNNKFEERNIADVFSTKPEIAIINVEGPLYFAAVQDLEDQISEMIDCGIQTIILRLRRMHLIASSGISTLEVLIRRSREKGGRIMLTGVTDAVLQTLHDCGLDQELRPENIYIATEIPYESTRMALNSKK